MKKMLGMVACVALFAASAFAQVSFGMWSRAVWNVRGAYDKGKGKNTVITDMTQSWGGPSPRINLVASAKSQYAGFTLEIQANGGDGPWGDRFIWVQPWSWLKVTAGAGLGVGGFETNLIMPLFDFARIGIVTSNGSSDVEDHNENQLYPGMQWGPFDRHLNIEICPPQIPLRICLTGIDSTSGQGTVGATNGDTMGKESAFYRLIATGAVNASYAIPDVGVVRVGAFGFGGKPSSKYAQIKDANDYSAWNNAQNKEDWNHNRVVVTAGFELTAIDGVWLALGAKIPVSGTVNAGTGLKEPIRIQAATNITLLEGFSFKLRAGFGINGGDPFKLVKDNEFDGAFGFLVDGSVEYDIPNVARVFAEVGYGNSVWMNAKGLATRDQEKGNITFGVGINRAFSNGEIGIAFEGSTNGGSGGWVLGDFLHPEKGDGFGWVVPIHIGVWF